MTEITIEIRVVDGLPEVRGQIASQGEVIRLIPGHMGEATVEPITTVISLPEYEACCSLKKMAGKGGILFEVKR